MYDGKIPCSERSTCHLVEIAAKLHNDAVKAESQRSPINIYVVQRDNSMSDEALKTPEGKRTLLWQHITHGGVGRFTKGAYDYLRAKGEMVEEQMIPV